MANILQLQARGLINELININNDILGNRINDLLTAGAAIYTGSKVNNLLITLVDRFHRDTLCRPAIQAGDDHILRDINKFPRQVTRIGCLECSVGKSLTGTVGGDKIFEHGKSLTEIGGDRPLDNLTGRLGHEAPHTR